MFKDAKGKFDGRIFIGVMMGLGTITGGALKLYWSVADTVPPFWLWAIPIGFITIGVLVWVQRRRDQNALRDRLERSARVDALRPRSPAPTPDITAAD